MRARRLALALWIGAASAVLDSDGGVSFYCVGNCDSPRKVESRGGNAMMGGHMYAGVTIETDLIAYRWFLERAAGGDVLVLTADAAPCDIYNPFIYNMSSARTPNSVTTACFTSRDGSSSKKLKALLDGASGLFVTGGDQSKYYDYWRGTAVAEALSSGVVVGGSSAGLAIQGEFLFDAEDGGVDSEDALKYPTDEDITLARDFLHIDEPWMRGVLTDTHFFQRDRMGRLVTFVARVAQDGWARTDNQSSAQLGVLGVGISEHTAVLVEGKAEGKAGRATFSGVGPVYFLKSGDRKPTTCEEGEPLSWEAPGLEVWRWNSTDEAAQATSWGFDSWSEAPTGAGAHYALTVHKGKLASTQPGGSIY